MNVIRHWLGLQYRPWLSWWDDPIVPTLGYLSDDWVVKQMYHRTGDDL